MIQNITYVFVIYDHEIYAELVVLIRRCSFVTFESCAHPCAPHSATPAHKRELFQLYSVVCRSVRFHHLMTNNMDVLPRIILLISKLHSACPPVFVFSALFQAVAKPTMQWRSHGGEFDKGPHFPKMVVHECFPNMRKEIGGGGGVGERACQNCKSADL